MWFTLVAVSLLIVLVAGFPLLKLIERQGVRRTLADVVFGLALGCGTMALTAVPAFYWWLHGSDPRYNWIISGPEPYALMGSGPFQIGVAAALALVGLILVAGALWFRIWVVRRR